MSESIFCLCVVKNRDKGESERDWLKRWMCMYHWMQTDYYRNKLTCEHTGKEWFGKGPCPFCEEP